MSASVERSGRLDDARLARSLLSGDRHQHDQLPRREIARHFTIKDLRDCLPRSVQEMYRRAMELVILLARHDVVPPRLFGNT
jgi:hypothetical protein